ncbi:MAG: transposase [Desulfobacterales bacterium]|nr:transposase [Desulfobacterales bacterium]
MPKPRNQLVSIIDTPYYHVISRCVRRAFLCGTDSYTGKCFEHRRAWIRDRIGQLESIFAIDIAAYAILHNHFHLTLRLSPESARDWTDQEVVERWARLFTLPSMVAQWQSGSRQINAEVKQVKEWIRLRKSRLCDLSWFMRCLNEPIARRANAEDGCTGRFWEGRFKSQALLDEQAVLTCMAYVDLNPIRAGMARTPETSDLTSIQQRILNRNGINLLPFNPGQHTAQPVISFALVDYFELLDWTGRAVLENKSGSIPEHLPRIIARLEIDPRTWVRTMNTYGSSFQRVVGPIEKIQALCTRLGQSWLCGLNANRLLYQKIQPG